MDRMVRRASSYFSRQLVESRRSTVNPLLEVAEVNGRMLLDSAHANYSFGSLHRLFEQAFDRADLRRRRIRHALLLGLGAGSVLTIVEERSQEPVRWTAVEIDPVVIELARKHFDLGRHPGLEVVCADASDTSRWKRARFHRYDLIVVDVFVDDVSPASIEAPPFLGELGASLAPGGILFFNRLAHTADEAARTDAFAQRFKRQFPDARVFEIQNNRVFVHEAPATEE